MIVQIYEENLIYANLWAYFSRFSPPDGGNPHKRAGTRSDDRMTVDTCHPCALYRLIFTENSYNINNYLRR